MSSPTPAQRLSHHIVADPAVAGGEPALAASGLPVRALVERARQGATVADILAAHPNVSEAELADALALAIRHPGHLVQNLAATEPEIARDRRHRGRRH